MKISALSTVIILVTLVLMAGCVSGNRIKAITPLESQLIAQTVMSAVINARNIPEDKLLLLRDVFMDSKNVLAVVLKTDLTDMSRTEDAVNLLSKRHAEKLGPYYEIVQSVLTVAIFRVRSAVDQEKTDLAAQHLDAVFIGTIHAIDAAL